MLTTRPFIDALRPICEIIFDLLLSNYATSLKAFYNNPVELLRKRNADKWKEAICAADKALDSFRDAEKFHQTQHTDMANSIAKEAMTSLKQRYGILTLSIIISNKLSSNVVWIWFQSFISQSSLWTVGTMRMLKKYESSCT
jgi:hypothetical protein